MELERLTRAELAAMLDHTLLKAFATESDIADLCREAAENGVGAVCVNPVWVGTARSMLAGTSVRIASVASFPLGQTTVGNKVREAALALENGASEIDYVLHVGRLRMGDTAYVETEMRAMTELCHSHMAVCKVIFENCYLTKEQIRTAAEIAAQVRPDFIKTSTGFGTGGALPEDVRLMREASGGHVRVKAAGGIRDWETCRRMLEAGAERIGTSSAPAILRSFSESASLTDR